MMEPSFSLTLLIGWLHRAQMQGMGGCSCFGLADLGFGCFCGSASGCGAAFRQILSGVDVQTYQDGANLFDDFEPKVHKAFSFLRSCALKYDGNNDSDGAE